MSEYIDNLPIDDSEMCFQQGSCSSLKMKDQELGNLRDEKRIVLEERDDARNEVAYLQRLINELFKPNNSAILLFSERSKDIESIIETYIVETDLSLDFIILVENYTEEIEDEIIDIQCEMYRVFREQKLDFLIVPLMGRVLEDCISSDAKSIESILLRL